MRVTSGVARPAASRPSQPRELAAPLSTHRDCLDGPNPDERVPGDPIAVVGAHGRAVRRQGNHATTNRQKIESDRWSAVADAQGLTRRAEFEAMLTLGREEQSGTRVGCYVRKAFATLATNFQTGVSGRVWRPPASASVTHLVS